MLHLRQAALSEGPASQQLRAIVRGALTAPPDNPRQHLQTLNQKLLTHCTALFPNKTSRSLRPRDTPAVKSCIADMWQRHRALKNSNCHLGRVETILWLEG